MRLPKLQPLASALQKRSMFAAGLLVKAILKPQQQKVIPFSRDEISEREPFVPANISAPAFVASTAAVVPELRETPPPHIPCKIYYPSISQLSDDQRRFYVYWRAEFSAGRRLPADATYRFLYAYELVREAVSADDLEKSWTALLRAYANDERFITYLASWIVDLRFLTNRYIVDDVLAAHPHDELRLDVAFLAAVPSSWKSIVECFTENPDTVERVAGYLSEGNADISAVTALVADSKPVEIAADFLSGLGTRQEMTRLVALKTSRPSFLANERVRVPIENLIASACGALGISTTADGELHFVASISTETRIPIVRNAIQLRAPEPADTLEGLIETIHHGMDDDARILLATVIAKSETLPYVEGRVDAEKTLRELFEAFAESCGRKATLGVFRHAYFSLGQGPRAVWVIEPEVNAAIDIKMSRVTARFTRGLQHALYGTNARRRAVDALTEALAKRTGCAKSGLVSALARGCGSSSAILPIIQDEAVV